MTALLMLLACLTPPSSAGKASRLEIPNRIPDITELAAGRAALPRPLSLRKELRLLFPGAPASLRQPGPPEAPATPKTRYRALFLSDLHLGNNQLQAKLALKLLDSVEADKIYLIGDIFDGYTLERHSWSQWTPSHSALLDRLIERAKTAEVIYVPGDHDQVFRAYVGRHLDGIRVRYNIAHTAADGREFWIVHGDQFDQRDSHNETLRYLAVHGQRGIAILSSWINKARVALGLHFWPMSTLLKSRLSPAASFIARYEETVAAEAGNRGYDGVITGHSHAPIMREIDGISYFNAGDWVENCVALVEDLEGRFSLIPTGRRLVSHDERRLPKPAAPPTPDR